MSCKKLVLFIISLLVLFSNISVKSQEGDSLYYTNPDRRVAEMLFEKRIVMLGDYAHHSPVVTGNLLNILYHWLSLAKNSEKDTINLTLILEVNNNLAVNINDYIHGGIEQQVIYYLTPKGCIEDLELYTKLRAFYEAAKKYNHINIEVCGFEEDFYSIPDKNYQTKSKRDAELWFINERDSVLSEKISGYAGNHSENMILVFYGAGHLVNGNVDKNLGFDDLAPEECYGYYLVHYLKKNFGDNNIASVFQGADMPDYNNDSRFEKVKNREILTGCKNANMPVTDCGDFYLYRKWKYIPLISNGLVPSRYIIEKTIKYVKELEPDTQGFHGKKDYRRCLDRLFILTGKRFLNSSEADKWYDYENSAYNGIKRLESEEFSKQVKELFYNDVKSSSVRGILFELGFPDSIFNMDYVPDSSEWETIWNTEYEKIKLRDVIGILILGYADEKVKAKEYLVKFSGEDFAEPEKYLQWYRMKYYGYKY